jgi:hypothetical protein
MRTYFFFFFFLVSCTKAVPPTGPVESVNEPEAIPEVVPVTSMAPESIFLDIPMATATAMDGESTPFDALEGGTWKAPENARWVKAHFYFGERISLEKISFTYCGEDKPNRIYGFINFDEQYANLVPENDVYSVDIDPIDARSLTLNFGETQGVCLKDIKFVSKGQQVIFVTPRRVAGTVSASSTLVPEEAYEAMNLFDSRLEYAWSSDDAAENVTLDFQFEEEQTITGLRLWNGYQRSAVHCWKNARPMTVRFEAVGTGAVQDAVLADKLGNQEWDFGGAELTGTDFRLTIVDAFAGKSYQDMVVSELRFMGGDTGQFLIDSRARIAEKAQANEAQFAEAGLAHLLNASLQGEVEQGVQEESDEIETMDAGMTLRLRSDGSFYFNGNIFEADWEQGLETTIQIFGLGNYHIKSVGSDNITLRLFGLLRELEEEYPMGMDCNGCGRDCSQEIDESGAKATMFSDVVELIAVGEGMYRLDDKDKTPELGFRRALLQLEGE